MYCDLQKEVSERRARDEQRLGTRDFGGAPDKGRRDKFRPSLPTARKKPSCGEKSRLAGGCPDCGYAIDPIELLWARLDLARLAVGLGQACQMCCVMFIVSG